MISLLLLRVRGEWARLRAEGCASVWAPASQESSHVGHAGVGVVSMRGAPLSLRTLAIAQFKRFFDCGRALRCMLPVASCRFLHLVVLYGYHGAAHLLDCWRLQRGTHQNPLPGKRDFGWALG